MDNVLKLMAEMNEEELKTELDTLPDAWAVRDRIVDLIDENNKDNNTDFLRVIAFCELYFNTRWGRVVA